MQWTAWANQAFKNQLTLLNWFPGRQCPSESRFKLKELNGNDLGRVVAAQNKAVEFLDDVDLNTMICIVSWCDGMQYLPYYFISC